MTLLAPGPVSAAIAAAQPGDLIRLQSGVYPETLVVDRAVTIMAETPGETVISPPGNACALYITGNATVTSLVIDTGERQNDRGVINNGVEIVSASPHLQDLRCTGAGIGLLVSGAGSCVRLDGGQFLRCRYGVHVTQGGRALLFDCVIADTFTYPLLIDTGGTVEAVDTQFVATTIGAVIISADSYADFAGCIWRESPTVDQKQRRFEAQLIIMAGGAATLRAGCRGLAGPAIGILVEGGKLTMDHAEISGNGWAGLQLSRNAIAELAHCDVSANGGVGVLVTDASVLTARDLRVCGNKAVGVLVSDLAAAEIIASRISGNLGGALLAGDGRLRLVDCDLSGNLNGPTRIDGRSSPEMIRVRV